MENKNIKLQYGKTIKNWKFGDPNSDAQKLSVVYEEYQLEDNKFRAVTKFSNEFELDVEVELTEDELKTVNRLLKVIRDYSLTDEGKVSYKYPKYFFKGESDDCEAFSRAGNGSIMLFADRITDYVSARHPEEFAKFNEQITRIKRNKAQTLEIELGDFDHISTFRYTTDGYLTYSLRDFADFSRLEEKRMALPEEYQEQALQVMFEIERINDGSNLTALDDLDDYVEVRSSILNAPILFGKDNKVFDIVSTLDKAILDRYPEMKEYYESYKLVSDKKESTGPSKAKRPLEG